MIKPESLDPEQEARVNAALTEVFGYALRASPVAVALDVLQGHTREQIGLAQDEGLTAHHVYCRVVTEDL